jgi:ABC-type nitrate/sulfonate/bicarbonate transport system permease component
VNLYVEFIFAVIFILGKLLQILSDSTESLNEDYIYTAKSLGVSKGQILSKVIWKDLKPNVYDKLISIHTQTWVVVIVYEFVSAVNGIGSVYKLAYDYNDLAAIISLGIFISLVIVSVNSILKIVVAKLIFWK